MLRTTTSLILLAITFATAFGVVFHDTQMDKAAKLALALPATLAVYAGVDSVIKYGDGHVHVERVSAPRHIAGLRSTLPRLQPRDDDRRQFALKRAYAYGGVGPTSLWPSQ